MHCVDLGESFPLIPTHIFLQNLASIQPRTSPFKFARSPRTDPPGGLRRSERLVSAFRAAGVRAERQPVQLQVAGDVRVTMCG